MKVNEKPYSRLLGKKIDENTFEFIDAIDLKHPHCPIVVIEGSVTALKNFNCSKCHKDKACVVKVDETLVCINCRFNDIGKDALYEGLYNGLD